jgi:hypothetical protein
MKWLDDMRIWRRGILRVSREALHIICMKELASACRRTAWLEASQLFAKVRNSIQ